MVYEYLASLQENIHVKVWPPLYWSCTPTWVFFCKYTTSLQQNAFFREHIWGTATAQKMKFSINSFFSKCDQIRRKSQIWSYLLKKLLMVKFYIFLNIETINAEVLSTQVKKLFEIHFNIVNTFSISSVIFSWYSKTSFQKQQWLLIKHKRGDTCLLPEFQSYIIRPWLLSSISEGHIYIRPWYSKD